MQLQSGYNMGAYRICKWGIQNFMVWIFMGSNLSLRGGGGVWGSSPKKILEIWSALGAILGLF